MVKQLNLITKRNKIRFSKAEVELNVMYEDNSTFERRLLLMN